MILNRNTILPAAPAAKPVQYALKALRRDFDRVFTDTAAPGGRILLTINDTLPAEQYTLTVDADTLLLSAADDLGFVYGLFEISRRFLGVQPFWFWNDQPFTVREGEKIPVGTVVESKSYKVKYRGWFVNDETLLSHWKVERRANLPFVMAFETLLRLGGNMVIPGTGKNAVLYRNALYERVWGEDAEVDSRTLDLHIQRLRKKLGWADKIETVYRVGYRLKSDQK